MSKTNTIIEINGKRYNALTGDRLHVAKPGTAKVAQPISDVIRPGAPKAHATIKPKTTPVALSAKTVDVRPPRHPASPAHLHKPQPSKTLMRQVVHKPTPTKRLRAQAPVAAVAERPAHTLEQKISFHHVDAQRERHAKKIAQNKLISRFGSAAAPSSAKLLRPTIVTPTIAAPYQISPKPTATSKATAQPSSELFERAIQHARSHEQTFTKTKGTAKRHKRRSSRIASISGLSTAVLLLGAFIAYQNMANLTLKVASARAGFAASLPDYRPAGFSVGKFKYQAGSVAINFASNSDKRHFAVVERVSNWDSATLLNDFVATTSGSASQQTIQSGGRTIYLYGNGNATWVNGGVWYQINNAASLSTNQLVKLATSI